MDFMFQLDVASGYPPPVSQGSLRTLGIVPCGAPVLPTIAFRAGLRALGLAGAVRFLAALFFFALRPWEPKL